MRETITPPTKTLQNILDFKNNLKIAWSLDGQKIAYSHIDPYTGQNGLYFMDLAVKKETPLNLTYDASKCVWSSETELYCGIPQNESGDVLSKISLETSPAVVTPLDVPRGTAAANMAQMIWDDRHASLIYKDLKDGNLYLFRPTR